MQSEVVLAKGEQSDRCHIQRRKSVYGDEWGREREKVKEELA